MVITVITASYNQGQYILDCLRSVQEQLLPTGWEVEHLVLDAYSTDRTLLVLEEWENASRNQPRAGYTFRFWSEKDEGQSDGFNKGILKARGQWIIWLNSDDLLVPGTFKRYIEALSSQRDGNVFYGHTAFIDEVGTFIRNVYHISWRPRLGFWGVYFPPTSGTLFKKDLFVKEPLSCSYHVVMDSEWFLRSRRQVSAHAILGFTCYFRVTDENKTGEHIKSGKVNMRHYWERVNYRRKWVWPLLPGSKKARRVYFVLGRWALRWEYRLLKVWMRLIATRRGQFQ